MRRRLMMETKLTQDWDVVWDYTMGLPEDNGFEKVINLNPEIKMTEGGLHIIPGGGYVRYTPIGFETCNEGIYEAEVMFYSFHYVSGFRMILSDGDEGLQIYCVSEMLRYNPNNSQLYDTAGFLISQLETNILYKIKIVRENGVNTVFLDDEKVYESGVLSTYYAFGNNVLFQDNGGYLLKSIKFKKIS